MSDDLFETGMCLSLFSGLWFLSSEDFLPIYFFFLFWGHRPPIFDSLVYLYVSIEAMQTEEVCAARHQFLIVTIGSFRYRGAGSRRGIRGGSWRGSWGGRSLRWGPRKPAHDYARFRWWEPAYWGRVQAHPRVDHEVQRAERGEGSRFCWEESCMPSRSLTIS